MIRDSEGGGLECDAYKEEDGAQGRRLACSGQGLTELDDRITRVTTTGSSLAQGASKALPSFRPSPKHHPKDATLMLVQ
jgi:hypothetical protein